MNASQLIHATGCTPFAAQRFVEAIDLAMMRFGIDTPARQAHFLAQCAHESAGFTRLEENLNYSWQRLRQVWPARFPSDAFAQQYHRQPEKIANYVYARRLGNGGVESGDGWRYIGRGLIQLTGRNNYARIGSEIGHDIVTRPQMVADLPMVAALSAAAWWAINGMNALADANDAEAVSRRVNGGTHGLADRLALTDRALQVLA